MSQLIYSIGLRRLQTLSNAINRLQIVQSTRNLSAGCYSVKNINANRSKSTLSAPNETLTIVPRRGLYSQESLGLDRVRIVRENKLELYQNNKDRYIERLAGYLDNGAGQSILKDDVTNLIGLAENEQHLDLIERIVTDLKTQDNFTESGSGTAVMRIYCTLNLVDRAYNNLKDNERFGEFFNQYTAYKIAMTMLFDAGRFDQVVEIFYLARDRFRIPNPRNEGQKNQFPGLSVVAFGALAKMNTQEAFEKAEKLYNEVDLNEFNFYLRMRVVTFLGYMAVNQAQSSLALNLISNAQGRNYITLRELRTISLSGLKRYEDVVYHLRDSISRHSESSVSHDTKRDIILRETFESLESKLSEIDDAATRDSLSAILDEIKQSKLIGDTTLDAMVFAPIGSRAYGHSNYSGIQAKQDSMNRQRAFTPRTNYVRGGHDRYGDGGAGEDDNSRSFQPRNRERGGNFGRRGGRDFGDDRRYQQQQRGKSYFEDDMEDGDFEDNAIDTQKRFR